VIAACEKPTKNQSWRLRYAYPVEHSHQVGENGTGMIGDFKRFDMVRSPIRQWRVLTPITWIAAYPRALRHFSRIDKKLPRGLKPPYFLLCNHNSFMDMVVTIKATFPHRANYVVAIDGFIGIEGLLRRVGGIGTRKFVKNAAMVKNMLEARQFGDIMVLYPEARYSLCGTGSELPWTVGKMIKSMDIPVVTLIMHGHHIDAPFWHGSSFGVKPVKAEMRLLASLDEVRSLSVDELNHRLAEAFTYDDWAWQKANGIRVKDPRRAEGLHRVLYQCPSCSTEFKMRSQGDTLSCGHCGKAWRLGELGDLKAVDGATEFTHIPDWYEWQRANVRREVEDGVYSMETPVRIESLPNTKGFVKFDKPGRLVHNMDGFTLTGEYDTAPFTEQWPVPAQTACHIEYNYMRRGDCVDLSTLDDSFYLFPPDDGTVAVTKIALATEELYRRYAKLKAAQKEQAVAS